jgi:hypothetical protein
VKVGELREGLARMDGDDVVMLRVHAHRDFGPGGVSVMVEAKAAWLMRLGTSTSDEPEGSAPCVHYALLEAWV